MSNYDYIIIGAGAAGLLLADALGNDDFFADKSILIIDKDTKTQNDRTWCFWEHGEGAFDSILHKSWHSIFFAGNELELSTNINPYSYKMLRGIDFYNCFVPKVKGRSNLTWIQDEVVELKESKDRVVVFTGNGTYSGKQVFSSWVDINVVTLQDKYPMLQQHFLGWFIQTEKPVFNAGEATFMDFSIPQKGNTRFMYVLPFSENEALVEYTLFSEELLEKDEYENAIESYIQEKFDASNFEVMDVEQGSIPMTCYPFQHENSERIFHIGIAGGWAKPSTGFTFYNTHKKINHLVTHLKQGKELKEFCKRDRFWFYDLLLLDILYKENQLGRSIFESMFKKRKTSLILKFLDNETTFWEDLKIISACPKLPFLKALWNRVF